MFVVKQWILDNFNQTITKQSNNGFLILLKFDLNLYINGGVVKIPSKLYLRLTSL